MIVANSSLGIRRLPVDGVGFGKGSALKVFRREDMFSTLLAELLTGEYPCPGDRGDAHEKALTRQPAVVSRCCEVLAPPGGFGI